MIAVDTSALVAIVLNEPERGAFRARLRTATKALISSASIIEARMVIHSRLGAPGVALLEDLMRLSVFEVVPPGEPEIEAAFTAFLVYGKGSGHPAALNFGDLFSYAHAKVRNVPLLFKGDDFARTDIAPALAPSR